MSKKKVTSFTASERDLEVIDALGEELKLSRSAVLVMGCYFLKSMFMEVKKSGENKVIEFKTLLASRESGRVRRRSVA